MTFLRYHAGNTKTLKAEDIESAAQKANRDFRKALESESEKMGSCRITRYSALFRGRIRWSIIYIEHTFVSYLKSLDLESVSPNSCRTGFVGVEQPTFKTATNLALPDESSWTKEKAEEAANYIKLRLKRRVKHLKEKDHYLLLKDLYSTAIRAVLMHEPTIFPTDKLARMITEGFAILDPGGSSYAPNQKPAEPIAVDAVMEYLRDKGLRQMEEGQDKDEDDSLENVLRNLLFDNQDDASSFGKSTEYYFAWVGGASGLIGHDSDES